MKKILLLSIVFIANHLFAQEPFFDLKKYPGKKQYNLLFLDRDKEKADSLKKYFDQFPSLYPNQKSQAKLLSVLPNGTRIFVLPQDNMACIVPDLKQFNMPNPAKGKKVSGMPPGSSEGEKLIPDFEN